MERRRCLPLCCGIENRKRVGIARREWAPPFDFHFDYRLGDTRKSTHGEAIHWPIPEWESGRYRIAIQ